MTHTNGNYMNADQRDSVTPTEAKPEESEKQSHVDDLGVPTEAAVLRAQYLGFRLASSEIKEIAEQLLAIELLEYHDANHLAGDNKTRSETKLALLRGILRAS